MRRVVTSWNAALDSRDASALAFLYAKRVLLYGRDVPRAAVIALKGAALRASPTFHQEILGDLYFASSDAGTTSVRFQKRSGANGAMLDVQARLVLSPDEGGVPVIVEETDEVTDEVTDRARARALAEECEATALRVVESLPEVKREEASLRASISESGNPALRFGGFVGPGADDVGFNGMLGIDGPERFEAHIFYGVDGAGKLTVSIGDPESLPLKQEALLTVARACKGKGYDYWSHLPP